MRMILILLAVMIVASGCETLTGQQQRLAQTRLHNEVANMKVDLNRLERRLEGIEADRESIYIQLADLQQLITESNARHEAELGAVDAQVKAQMQAQEALRRELADELSKRIAKILETQAAATTATRAQSGYVHTVKAGQTLSEIAREYHVSTAVIVKENNLKNPHDIKVGQELFIPD
jgi:LysM repeat protein